MSLALLIVDLDGTLVDSFADMQEGIEVALQALGVAPTPALLGLCRRGVPLETYYRHAVDRDPALPAEAERFLAFTSAYRHHYLRNQQRTRPYDGVASTLAEIRARWPELRLAVGTGKRTDTAHMVLEQAGLLGFFDLVQGSEDVAKKPDPALLQLVARRMGVALDRAVMVGDTDADVLAARAAGCRSVAVTYGGFSRQEMEALRPDRLIDRFAQLVDALHALEGY